jgi:hypothetical protein
MYRGTGYNIYPPLFDKKNKLKYMYSQYKHKTYLL